MRPVEAMFTDSWTIVQRAWWPITAIGLVLWGLWSLLVVLLAAVVRLGEWARLWAGYVDVDGAYPDGLPVAMRTQLQQQATDLFDEIGAGTWLAAGVILFAATVLVASAHYAATYRLGAEAASQRSATFRTGIDGMRTGTLRILGYNLLLVLLFAAVFAAVVGIAAVPALLTETLVPLTIGLGLLMVVLAFVAMFGLYGRLLPAFVQACVPTGAGALRWSWRVTRGRLWAVLGRYLLWSLAVSVVLNLVYSALSLPLLLGGLFAWYVSPGWPLLIVSLIGIVVLSAVTALSWLGPVAIWRDLTGDGSYRAIDDDGSLVTYA